jgi:putative FmdB family regulatory protein
LPIYRYQCECGLQSDEFRKIDNRNDPLECPKCKGAMGLRIMPTSVRADIQPYRSVVVDKATGKLVNIESRAQHKEFLHRNDYVEVGNDWQPPSHNDGPADAPMLSVEEMKKQGFHEETF